MKKIKPQGYTERSTSKLKSIELYQDRDIFNAMIKKYSIQVCETAFYIRFVNPSNHKSIIFVLPSPNHFKYKIAKINQIL